MGVEFSAYPVISKQETMIDGDLFPTQPEPLPLRCSRARFRMKLPFLDEVELCEVEGDFVRLERTSYKGFRYWALMLRDESNVLNVLFPETSGFFVFLLRHLVGRRFSYVDILLNKMDEDKRLIVLLDGRQVEPIKDLQLPKITKYKVIDGKKVERHDYSKRLEAIESIVNEVNKCNPCA